jgi:hypothetical protein
MERAFEVRLYRLFRALDDAGLAPGMTSGFRDDYRQSIASGTKLRLVTHTMVGAGAAAMGTGLQPMW